MRTRATLCAHIARTRASRSTVAWRGRVSRIRGSLIGSAIRRQAWLIYDPCSTDSVAFRLSNISSDRINIIAFHCYQKYFTSTTNRMHFGTDIGWTISSNINNGSSYVTCIEFALSICSLRLAHLHSIGRGTEHADNACETLASWSLACNTLINVTGEAISHFVDHTRWTLTGARIKHEHMCNHTLYIIMQHICLV